MAEIKKYDNHVGFEEAMAQNGNRLVSLVECSRQKIKKPEYHQRSTRTNQQRIGT